MGAVDYQAPTVRHYVAGGNEHAGGIGRLVGYIMNAESQPGRHLVTDTRGKAWNPALSPWSLARSITAMGWDRLFAPDRLHHLHIAGRGSTVRKTVLGLWAQAIGARYIMHLHDFDYAADLSRRPKWQTDLIAQVFRGALHSIALGERDRKTLLHQLCVPVDRVSVLRNCVPDPGLHQRGQDNPQVHIVFLGRLGERKGVPELLSALVSPVMQEEGWIATLAGDGPVQQYKSEAAALGLGDQVKFTGWLSESETQKLCASADILVLPSHAEGFAMAILEGLANRLAVVTTRVGAHDEVLVHEENCLFVPVGDASALGNSLSQLVKNPDLRNRLAESGRTLFRSEFGIDRYMKKLNSLYAEVEERCVMLMEQT